MVVIKTVVISSSMAADMVATHPPPLNLSMVADMVVVHPLPLNTLSPHLDIQAEATT